MVSFVSFLSFVVVADDAHERVDGAADAYDEAEDLEDGFCMEVAVGLGGDVEAEPEVDEELGTERDGPYERHPKLLLVAINGVRSLSRRARFIKRGRP
jgi:hypothetical protein